MEDNKRFEVGDVQKQHPNVMSFHFVTGIARYFVVGCYIPPKDLTMLSHVLSAWQLCPGNCAPLLIGDLNINLGHPFGNDLEQWIAEDMGALGLEDISRHFDSAGVNM